MKAYLSVAAGLALFALGACTAVDPALEQDPNYAVGYSDGCTTGNARVVGFDATVSRNEALWDESDAYRIGWRKGFNMCGAARAGERRDDFLSTDRYDQGAIKP